MNAVIRPARAEEYDEIARVWMESWASTGIEEASNFLLAKLRARVPREIENGWTLFVADDNGALAAMLALHLPELYLDQLFVAPAWQGRSLGRQLLAFTRATAERNRPALRARERKSLALVRARGFCIGKGAGRADDRLCDEILSLEARAYISIAPAIACQ